MQRYQTGKKTPEIQGNNSNIILTFDENLFLNKVFDLFFKIRALYKKLKFSKYLILAQKQ